MHDLIIRDGTIYDGNGGAPFRANIGIKNGKIAEIGLCEIGSKKEINALGCIVTPGFIDLHTHYDGQVSWDEELMPSVNHGVTTAVLGNCGVGFAPCKKGDRDRLIRLMEGVEDIPGTALHEGLTWDWETFPEYMDAIEKIPHTIDLAVQIPHDPLRVYAMGDRATANEPATPKDIETMKHLVREAMDAGAVGFSTGRSDFHKTSDGDWTPASEAGVAELTGIASVIGEMDYGVLQAVSDFDMIRPGDNFDREFELLEAFFKAGGQRSGSMSLMQRDFVPNDWKKIMERSEALKAEDGIDIRFQVAPRAIGSFLGLGSTFHPLMAFPSFLEIADKPLAEKVALLKDPALKTKMLSETPVQLSGPDSPVPPMVDLLIAQFEAVSEKLFRLDNGNGVDYEPDASTSLAQQARDDGMSPWEKAYDILLEDDGKALIYYPVYNYTEMNYNNVLTMMRHPQSLPGLSDGGAHVGFICDAGFPTFLLSYWTRDRIKNGRSGFDLVRAVEMLTANCADYLGLSDRGRIEVGKKADINVIDYDNLSLDVPTMVKDLPAGGQRLLQPVTGYKATFVSGEQIIANDQVTNARPGKLVRASA
jgi:N-acyl-D-aspartate/D-glutamate deacylase